MRLHRLCLALAAFAAATLQLPAHAERTPARPLPLAESAGNARVIVKFRENASVVRAHALAAGGAVADVASTAAARASSLGARHGVLLRAGAAITERSQVVQADGIGSRELAARLALDPEVEYAEPDRRVRRVAVPNDPFFTTVSGSQGPASGQWYLRAPAGEVQSAINAVTAWDRHTGNPAVIVAVLDTGVRSDHPDLAGKLLSGYDMVSDTRISNDGNARDADASDPGDWLTQSEINAGVSGDPDFWDGCEASNSSWHGTQVSGIVAAATQNALGMAGSGRHVRVLPVRVLGKCFGYVSDIVAGMRWAAGLTVAGVPANPNPAKVINLSLGSGGTCTQSEADAVTAINAAGAVVVAAAGNTAGRAAGSPANCGGAIGVAGLRHVGTKVGFSDVGPELSIAAPGGNCVNLSGACLYPILTTVNNGAQGPATNTYSDGLNNVSVGTSFSAPLVSGTAALLYSVRASITPAQVRSALQSSARPFPTSGQAGVQACQAPGNVDQLECYCTTTTCGAGMLDADGAVRTVLGASGILEPVVVNQTASPQAGAAVTLTSGSSVVPGGRSIVARRWNLVQGGGSVSAFSGATDGETVSMTPSAAGTVTVQLALTDDRGFSTATDFTFSVAAAAGQPPAGGGGGSSGGGGGGGAMSWAWLLGLAVVAAALSATGRRKLA
jgi:serine protease